MAQARSLQGSVTYSTDREDEGRPTSDELEKLGVDIGENWVTLGCRLGVHDAKLNEVDQHHKQMSEKGYHMLKHWSQKNGSDATYQALCDGLLNELVQRRDLAEKFCYINVSQKIKKGSSIRKKRKASSSSYGYQDKAKCKTSQQTSEQALDQETAGEIISRYGAVQDLLSALRTFHDDTDIASNYCEENLELMDSLDVIDLIVDAIKMHKKEAKILKNACRALASIVEAGEVFAYQLLKDKAIENIISAYNNMKTNDEIVENICILFSGLVKYENIRDEMKLNDNITKVLSEAESNFSDDEHEDLLMAAARALAMLGGGQQDGQRNSSAQSRPRSRPRFRPRIPKQCTILK